MDDVAAARDHRRGIAAMLLAVAVLCLMDACMKQLAGHYPPMQVAALRGLVGLPLVVAWAAASIGLRPLVQSGDVRFRWVKGHSGDPMNDLVDALAVAALSS